jgi:ATP-dependent helicase/nuclease subunit B
MRILSVFLTTLVPAKISLPTRIRLIMDKLTLTVNQRLCIETRRHIEQQNAQTKNGWTTPNILPLTTWVEKIWRRYTPTQHLLNGWQEYLIWERIVTADHQATLLNVQQTTALAQSAWQTCQIWQIDTAALDAEGNNDISAFIRWSTSFMKTCQRSNWICSAQLTTVLSSLLQTQPIALPQHIEIVGFDDINPALQQLLNVLSNQATVTIKEPKQAKVTPEVLSFNDTDEELKAAANWAYRMPKQPGQKIAIIVPDLGQSYPQVERIFSRLNNKTDWYNVSASRNLANYPLIAAACAALLLDPFNIKIKDSYQWLQSPYLTASESERQQGAQIDRQLREQNLTTISIGSLYACLNKMPNSTWLNRLRAFFNYQQQLPKKAKPSEWVEHWSELLFLIGWPGYRGCDSIEHQLIERFTRQLHSFALLDEVLPAINYRQATQTLKTELGKCPFQPEGSTAPVQVIGLLEAAGLHFDSLWLTGLDNHTWPPAAKPNPFLPFRLQQEHNMPHACATRELEFCQQVMQRILSAAENIAFSWAQSKANKTVMASPLITHFKENKVLQQELTNNGKENHKDNINEPITETISADTAPSIESNETIRGGSSILKLQASCPFKAFATIRLQAQALPEPINGLTAAQKGTIVHAVLESVWNRLQNQQTLLNTPAPDLTQLITEQVQIILREYKPHFSSQIEKLLMTTEQQRLIKLIGRWLELEKQRSPFNVLAHESRHQIQLGKLKLKLSIDRIDQLPCGKKLIIDYKTGTTSTRSWFADTLEEPQLPLYCAYVNQKDDVRGISFAQVQTKQLKFNGVAANNVDALPSGISTLAKITKDNTTWEQLVQQWQTQLAQLGYAFSAGQAQVKPVSKQTCQFCTLQSLCRKTS